MRAAKPLADRLGRKRSFGPSPYYGDLHFHTWYSDNRDRASVAQMVRRGLERGISIFGTGDHNHDMTTERFNSQIEETAEIRRMYPKLVIVNNCEITFLIGHFHVFNLREITGTIDEAYEYLHGNHHEMIMVNHPGMPDDEWNSRIIPSAVGSSDAHSLEEMGSGATGFYIEKPDVDGVFDAVRQRRTFATTAVGFAIDWRLEQHERDGTAALHWTVTLPDGSDTESGSLVAILEIRNRDCLSKRAN